MTPVRTSAPGKVVICGEYAVLDGAPALVMAIDRRASVAIKGAAGVRSMVSAPGFRDPGSQFSYSKNSGFDWHGDGAILLLEYAWRQAGPDLAAPIELTLDTRAFRDAESGAKFGLGSSAALTTALVWALAKLAGEQSVSERLAQAAHRDFQGGRGSGVDVAASCNGGVTAYRMSGPSELLAWPGGLEYAILWSGVPADTKPRLERFAASTLPDRTRALGAAAQAVLDSWTAQKQVFGALRDYAAGLHRFSADSGLGIFDGGHESLFEMARDYGVVYKPCGAGGGDIGIALAEDRAGLRRFVGQAAATGFIELDLATDDSGVRYEEQDQIE